MLSLLRNVYFPLSLIMATLIGFPILLLRPFNVHNIVILQKIFNFISTPIMGFRFRIEGQDNINENTPCVVIGNHQHNFDVLMYSVGFPPRTIVIGKKEIAMIPVFGQAYWLSGNILLNRKSNKKAVESLGIVEKRMIEEKLSILIFPEGHRNTEKELLPFKKGAYYTAIKAQVPIVCFSVSSYARNMNLNKLNAGSIHIKFHPPITTIGLTIKDIPSLMEKTLQIIKNGRDELDKSLGY